jgi:hypothetical protein
VQPVQKIFFPGPEGIDPGSVADGAFFLKAIDLELDG